MSPVWAQATNAGCQSQPPAWQNMTEQDIVLHTGQGGELNLPVRLADEPHERSAGYQWICPENAANTAMIFTFAQLMSGAFHMRNVYVPLTILFFDNEGELVDAMPMHPEANGLNPPRYYHPKGRYQYALEIPQGFTANRLLHNQQVSLDIQASGLHK